MAKELGKWPWEVGELPFHRYRYLRRVVDKVSDLEEEAYERAKRGEGPLKDVDWDAEEFSTMEPVE